MDNKTLNLTRIAIGIGAAIVLYKLADFFGLIKSQQEKEQEKSATALETGSSASTDKIDLNNGSLALSPNYVSTIGKKILADYKKAGKKAPDLKLFWGKYSYDQLSKQVYNAKGIFNDDEDSLFGVFRTLNTQFQIAFLSNYFYKLYKKDLLSYILGFTNTEERAKLYDIIKNKKLY